MKVLLYGGGAREHALAYKLKSSPLLTKLYLCNPNDGFSSLGEIINANSYKELAETAKEKNINLLVVGPENPLAEGITDEFKKVAIPVIGADKKWAKLESSKAFAKDFMFRNNIPTAKYQIVDNIDQISSTLETFNLPVVIKADGLAAGKGVQIVSSKLEAKQVLTDFLEGKYGEASKKIIVEEFLDGEEISLISLWDGKTLLPLVPARDYKRLSNYNEGPNTGGMGAYCPVKLTSEQNNEIINYLDILKNALTAEKADFIGIIYSGLMLTDNGIYVLEYNMRFGDPETQALMIHLESDLLEVFNSAVNQQLSSVNLEWKTGTSMCLVVASEGYPYNPKCNCEIKNINELIDKYKLDIFFAGVKKIDNKLVSNGGRVLSICKTNNSNDIYDAAEELIFEDKHYRIDIGVNTDERTYNNSRI